MIFSRASLDSGRITRFPTKGKIEPSNTGCHCSILELYQGFPKQPSFYTVQRSHLHPAVFVLSNIFKYGSISQPIENACLWRNAQVHAFVRLHLYQFAIRQRVQERLGHPTTGGTRWPLRTRKIDQDIHPAFLSNHICFAKKTHYSPVLYCLQDMPVGRGLPQIAAGSFTGPDHEYRQWGGCRCGCLSRSRGRC